ncbi:MAG TPA: VOC family protein [Anaeromyxobacter sp.]|nr:VOC family protein [Anaeromyxobacter sp.]
MAHPFVYAELHSPEVERDGSFYSRLFGWKITRFPIPGKYYAEISPGEGLPGGLTEPQPQLRRFAGWLTYVGVDDLPAAVRKARELGATVVQEEVVIPDGGGRYAWILDPAGSPLGLWEKSKR